MKKKLDAFKSDEEGYVKKKEYLELEKRIKTEQYTLKQTK